MNIATNDR